MLYPVQVLERRQETWGWAYSNEKTAAYFVSAAFSSWRVFFCISFMVHVGASGWYDISGATAANRLH